MPNDPSLIDYYARRAGEYERLYAKPERQADLQTLKELCGRALAGHQVLEIACGTGYWTLAASQSARAITATDINPAMLEIARSKTYSCPVSFHGSEHEVLKNFPAEGEVREVLADRVTEFNWNSLPYYWFLTYRLA